MTERHMLDLPSDVDQVRLLCGPKLADAERRAMVTGSAAITTCLACLRCLAAKQEYEIENLNSKIERLEKELAARPPAEP